MFAWTLEPAWVRSFYFSYSWKANYFDLILFMTLLYFPSGRWVWSIRWCETGQLEPGRLAPVPSQGTVRGERPHLPPQFPEDTLCTYTVVGDSLSCSVLFSPPAHFSPTQGEMGSRRVCRPCWVLFSKSQTHERIQALRHRLTPGGPWKEVIRLKLGVRWDSHDGTNALLRRGREASVISPSSARSEERPCEQEGGCLWLQKRGLTKNRTWQHFDLGLPSLQNFEK